MMSGAMTPIADQAPVKRPRLPVIDIARGVAIVAMVIYHLSWDLSYYGFIPVDVGYDPGWVFFARSILFSFMFLVGVGLVLGHGDGVRWKNFWRPGPRASGRKSISPRPAPRCAS